MIHDQLMCYLLDHSLITKAQHGFLANKSTGSNLLSCFNDRHLSVKNRKFIDIIYLDFKKAFDSLVHPKVIAKIASYGVNYELLSWIQAFLTGRSQRVVIENVLSNPIAVGSGVVQGSVLGPLIFILFINDIVDCLDTDEVNPTTCCIFADDMKLYSAYEAATDSSSLSNTLKNIESWSHKWQLPINPEKSLLMQVGSSKHDRPKYFICDKLIAPSDLIRDLGITYDSKLCFHDYINEIVGRAYQRVNLLFRSFVSQNVSILTRAFLTYVRPILEYCTSIWSPHKSYLIDKIERVQRYFTRRVLFRTKLSYIERLQILNLELLEARRIKSDLKLCFKIINGLCDLDVDAFFKFASQSSVTRGHNKKLVKPICNNNWQLNFFSSRIVNIWNSLPPELVNVKSTDNFATKLKKYDLSVFCKGGRA